MTLLLTLAFFTVPGLVVWGLHQACVHLILAIWNWRLSRVSV